MATAAAVLGHRQLETTQRWYNRATSLDAGQRYHEALDALPGRKRARRKTFDLPLFDGHAR
jgi:hypothetical protein